MDNDKTTKSYTDGYAIKISSDSRRCFICFDEPQPELCKSLEKLNVLCNLIISPSYEKLSFLMNSIKSLQHVTDPKHNNYQKFTYNNGITMAKCIGFQIFHLEQAERTLSWLTMKNIYVIDDTYYIYLGVKELVEINEDQHFTIFSPILKKKNTYLAPELTSVSTIPASYHKNAVYYSLAQVIVVSLMPNQNKSKVTSAILFPIVDTSLYWFLIRCFRIDPKSRICLLF